MHRSCVALLLSFLAACGGGAAGAPSPADGGAGGSGDVEGPGGSGGGGSGGDVGPGGSGGDGGTGGVGGSGGEGGTGGVVAETGAIAGELQVDAGVDPTDATVLLTGPDATTAETRADAAGAFRFADLAPGGYRLEATLPPHWPARATVQVARGRTSRAVLSIVDQLRLGDGALGRLAALGPAADRALLQIGCGLPGCRLVAWDDATGRGHPLFDDETLVTWGGTFSPDGRYLAVYGSSGPGGRRGVVFDFVAGTRAELGPADSFWFDPGSRWLTTSTFDGAVVTHRMADGAVRQLCDAGHVLEAPGGSLLCRDSVAGLLRWDPGDDRVELIGEGEVAWRSPELDRLLMKAPGAHGANGRTPVAWWRSGFGAPVRVADAVRLEAIEGLGWMDDAALWIDEGLSGDAGRLVRVDLETGAPISIDTGVDSFTAGPERRQVYFFGDIPGWEPDDGFFPVDGFAPLRSWDEATGTAAVAAAVAYDGVRFSAWPDFGLFEAPGTDGVSSLHVHRFADGTVTPLEADARLVWTGRDGVAYLHDCDEARTSCALSVVFPDAPAPVQVVRDEALERTDPARCSGPIFSPALDRAMLNAGCSGGVGSLMVWDRTLGLRRLGRGTWMHSTGLLDRLVYLRIDDADETVGELRVFDLLTWTDRSIAGLARAPFTSLRDGVAFFAAGDVPEQLELRYHDVASGSTSTVSAELPPTVSVQDFRGLPGTLTLYVPLEGEPGDYQVWAWRAGGATARKLLERPSAWLASHASRWVVIDEPDATGVGHLVFVDLASLEATTIATGAGPAAWAAPDLRHVAWLEDGRDGTGSLFVTSLGHVAPLHVADGVPSWTTETCESALLTAGALIYEVVEGPSPGVYARLLSP